jgi:hypothetical protein
MMNLYIITIPSGKCWTFFSHAHDLEKKVAKMAGLDVGLKLIPIFSLQRKIRTFNVKLYVAVQNDGGREIKVKIGTYSTTFWVYAYLTTTVERLIFLLQQHVMMDLSAYSLYDKRKRLNFNQVAEEIVSSELTLLPPPKDDEMMIFVKTFSGTEYPINVKKEFTIDKVKGMIYARDGIPLVEQRLIHLGKSLADEDTIVGSEIVNGATLNLILYLRGGMFRQPSTGVVTGKVSQPKKEIRWTITIRRGEDKMDVFVELSYSVELVKIILEEILQTEIIALRRGGQVLDDDRSLAYYGVLFGETIDLEI